MIATDTALEFWLSDRTNENRERLVLFYTYLCKRGASKFHRPGLERSDLEQIAVIGLLKACDRFEPAENTPFEAYAWLFIVGELMHFVRDHERVVRAPRHLRSLERRVHEGLENLRASRGYEPTSKELADYLQIPRAQVDAVASYRDRAIAVSFESVNAQQLRHCAYEFSGLEDRLLIDQALKRLNELERTVIVSLYGNGLSSSEIAEKLGYSRRHISRLHRCALEKMQPVFVPN